jgi:hypothetical protein
MRKLIEIHGDPSMGCYLVWGVSFVGQESFDDLCDKGYQRNQSHALFGDLFG